MKRKFLFLYLDTGGGHRRPASILAQTVQKMYGAETVLLNGFAPSQFFSHTFFEKGYHTMCAVLPAAYSLFYDLTTWKPALEITKMLCTWRTVPFLKKVIREQHITDVVCFHFALAPAARRAVRLVNPSIPFTIVVTDPFTAHPSWFLERDSSYIVFSQQMKDHMRAVYGIDRGADGRELVHVFPFLIDSRYLPRNVSNGGAAAGTVKRILIAGGGEGLPGAEELASYFIKHLPPYAHLDIVCGRDDTSKARIERIKSRFHAERVRVFGFTTEMADLMRNADCVITKAGASTVMEVIACKKPLIISTYIHGQELGNVRHAVSNGTGWFIRRSTDIFSKAVSIISDDRYASEIAQRYEKFPLPETAEKMASFLYAKCSAT